MKLNPIHLFLATLATATAANGQTAGNFTTLDASGNATIKGNTTINGNLAVQAEPSPVTVTANATNAGQQNAVVGTNNGTSTAFRTTIGGTDAVYTTATGGGALIENDGDVTLNASTGSNNLVKVARVTEVRLYNADQGALAGQPVPNSQSYYLVDANGVEIAGSRKSASATTTPTQAQQQFEELLDNDGVADIDFKSTAFNNARTVTPLPATGGNLKVLGSTTTTGIDNSDKKITNLAAGTAVDDAVNVGQLDAEAILRAAADTTLQNNITAEATTRAAADTTLQNNITAEATTRAAADTMLQNNITAEATTRVAEDTAIRNEFRSADTAIRNDFQAADRALRSDIEKNTRGIAMVAAMHNTTVDAGKQHAMDFNIAQFDNSTGFALGYATRLTDSVQLNGAAASSEDFEEAVARVGISVQW